MVVHIAILLQNTGAGIMGKGYGRIVSTEWASPWQVDHLTAKMAAASTGFFDGRKYRSDIYVSAMPTKKGAIFYVYGHQTVPRDVREKYKRELQKLIDESGYVQTAQIDGLPYNKHGRFKIKFGIAEQKVDNHHGINGNGTLGDSGPHIAYATDETAQRIPLESVATRELTNKIAYEARRKKFSEIGPDIKTTFTYEVLPDEKTIRVLQANIAVQHRRNFDDKVKDYVLEELVFPYLDENGIQYNKDKIIVNRAGEFVMGGPHVDAGHSNMRSAYFVHGSPERWSFHPEVLLGVGRTADKDSVLFAIARYIDKFVVDSGEMQECAVRLNGEMGGKAVQNFYIVQIRGNKSEREIRQLEKKLYQQFGLHDYNIIVEKLGLGKADSYDPRMIESGLWGPVEIEKENGERYIPSIPWENAA
ncbi:MAG: methionine adenosyltransferase [Candidatus Micrarchaeota archaeon]|nr:methionine adenosyltransferase [Candidatus Micrarchaeota archaeon]